MSENFKTLRLHSINAMVGSFLSTQQGLQSVICAAIDSKDQEFVGEVIDDLITAIFTQLGIDAEDLLLSAGSIEKADQKLETMVSTAKNVFKIIIGHENGLDNCMNTFESLQQEIHKEMVRIAFNMEQAKKVLFPEKTAS